MGGIWTKIKQTFGYKSGKFIMVGDDNVGKTTTLYMMKIGQVVQTVPTVGFNIETLNYKKLTITCWDIPNRMTMKRIVKHYFEGLKGVIFIIDLSQEGDMWEHQIAHFQQLFSYYHIQEAVPLLIFANKIDAAVKSQKDIVDDFKLSKVPNKWHIQRCCAMKNQGLAEGFQWICQQFDKI